MTEGNILENGPNVRWAKFCEEGKCSEGQSGWKLVSKPCSHVAVIKDSLFCQNYLSFLAKVYLEFQQQKNICCQKGVLWALSFELSEAQCSYKLVLRKKKVYNK